MPTFDGNLNPEIAGSSNGLPLAVNPGTNPALQAPDASTVRSLEDLMALPLQKKTPGIEQGSVSYEELNANTRYSKYRQGADNEDLHGNAQSTLDKAANGILKGLNLAGTTVLNSGAMLGGVVKALSTGRLADVWDNEATRALDEWNKKVDQEYLPNYYTKVEQDANWYSPDNWMTANFLFDKLVKNSGFAVGAMITGNIANAGLSAAGSALGRGAWALNSSLKAKTGWEAFSKVLQPMARLFSQGKNIEAAQILEQSLLKGLPTAEKLAEGSQKLLQLAKQASTYSKWGDTGRRAMVALYSSAGESAFEALGAQNEFREHLIEEHKKKSGGLEPDEATLKAINAQADRVGLVSFMGNMALLGATEYVQLPHLMGSSYRAQRQAANSLMGQADDVAYDAVKKTWKKAEAATRFGKVYDKVTGIGKYFFDPKEAAQEGGQYALQVGVQNYYAKRYRGEDASAWVDGALFGLDQTLNSKEGMESMMLGGLTGGLMQAKSNFTDSKQRKKNTAALLGELNSNATFAQAFQDKLGALQRGVVLQEEHEKAVKAGDVLEAKDLEHDKLHNYMATRIKYGRYDMVQDDIDSMRLAAMEPGGFERLQAQGLAPATDTQASFTARLSEMERTAKAMKVLYESLNLRYSGVVNKDGKRLYTPEVLDKMVYAQSKIADYDHRLGQLAQDLMTDGVPVDKYNLKNIALKGIDEASMEELATRIDELDVVDDVKEELQGKVRDYVELNLRRQEYINDYNEITKKPQDFQEVALDQQAAEGKKAKTEGTVTVKTKTGDKDLEIGVEYFLGRVVKHDKHGKEVYQFPRMTILKVNEDGTLRVKGHDGVEKNISPAELEEYKIAKVSSVAGKPHAAFYLRNVNRVVFINLGKAQGGKRPGRLMYDPATDKLTVMYKDSKGRVKEREIGLDMFEPKKGYAEGVLSFGEKLEAADEADIKKSKVHYKSTYEARRAQRLAIIEEMVDESLKGIEVVDKRLAEAQDALQKTVKELDEVASELESGEDFDQTKAKAFRGVTKQQIKAAMRLSRTREALEKEIAELELEKAEMEHNLEFFFTLAENIDELPADTEEFVEELREQRSFIEDLILHTGGVINKATKSIAALEEATEAAIANVFSLIAKFEAKYPKAPTSAAPTVLNHFLEQNPNFLKLQPHYLRDLRQLEELIAQVEEKTITPNEKGLRRLSEKITRVNEQLAELEKTYAARQAVLQKFEAKLAQYKELKAKQERLLKDEAFRKEIFGTQAELQKESGDTSTGDPAEDEKLAEKEDARKDASILFTSTTAPSKDLKPHHHREQYFLNRADHLPNRANLRTMLVTAKNEEKFGLQGLVAKLLGTYTVPAGRELEEAPIVSVYVEQEGDTYYFINAEGERIGTVGETVDLDQAVYSVLPSAHLSTPSAGERFRSNQKAEAEAALEGYKAYRKEILALEGTTRMFEFTVSRGRPQEVINGEGVRVEKNSVIGTVATKADLSKQGLVVVSKGAIQLNNGTAVNIPKGRPMLVNGSDLVFLNNRNLENDEQETVFDLIMELAKRLETTDKLDRTITKYLQGILYWRVAKEGKTPGRNQIWIGYDGMLHFGSQGAAIPFTTEALYQQQDKLKFFLANTYTNVNDFHLSAAQFNKPYQEIVKVHPNGTLTTVTWKSYQHYLLSDTYDLIDEDSSGMQGKRRATLLTTTVRKLDDSTYRDPDGALHRTTPMDYNIEGKYATLKALELPKVAAPKSAAPAAPAAPATGGVVLDGKTKNLYTASKGEKIYFTATDEGPGSVVVLNEGDKAAAIKRIAQTSSVKNVVDERNATAPEGARQITYEEAAGEFLAQAIENHIAKSKTAAPAAPAASPRLAKLQAIKAQVLAAKSFTEAELNEIFKTVDEKGYQAFQEAYGQQRMIEELTPILTGGMSEAEIYNAITRHILPQYIDSLIAKEGKAPAPAASAAPAATGSVVLDGKTENEFTTSAGEKIYFTATLAFEDDLKLLDKGGLKAALARVGANPAVAQLAQEAGKPVEDAATAAILNAVKNHIEAEAKKAVPPATPPPVVEPVVEPVVTPTPKAAPSVSLEEARRLARQRKDGGAPKKAGFRAALGTPVRPEQWAQVEAWLQKNLPNVPLHRVQHLIRMTDNGWAWGKFENAAMTVYEGAEEGTTYHEAFEAVWGMFLTEAEQTALIREFRTRKGTFTDRETGRVIPHGFATAHQAKEAMAEEFRGYVLGEIQPKSLARRVLDFFRQLAEAIRGLFYQRPDAIGTLFKKINAGHYRSLAPVGGTIAAYRAVPGLTEQQTYDLLQHMTGHVLRKLLGTEGSKAFFNIGTQTREEVYQHVLEAFNQEMGEELQDIFAAYDVEPDLSTKAQLESAATTLGGFIQTVNANWGEAVKLNGEFLSQFNITFEEAEDSREERSNSDYARDAFKVDVKNASSAIKLLFATLLETYYPTREAGAIDPTARNTAVLQEPNLRESSILGYKLADFSKSFVQVLESLANTNGLDAMGDKLVALAKSQPNYYYLFKRLKGDPVTGKIDYSGFDFHDWQLLISFYNTFQKQKPTALVQYVKETGETYTSNSNLNAITKELQGDWIEALKEQAHRGEGAVVFNEQRRRYVLNPKVLQTAKLTYPKQQLAFLEQVGIHFTLAMYNQLSTAETKTFSAAVAGIRDTLLERQKNFEGAAMDAMMTERGADAEAAQKTEWAPTKLDEKSLDLKGHYTKLSELAAKTAKPHLASTAYNVENEKVQIYVQNNVLSVFENDFNAVTTLDELLERRPELTDVFAQHSQLLRKGGLFFDETGKRRDNPLKLGYIGGTLDETRETGQQRPTSKLTVPERLMQEINQNLNGWYYALVPADASTEWMMNLGNHISLEEFHQGTVWATIFNRFHGYLRDEIALAQSGRTLPLMGKRADQLRFFDALLDDATKKALLSAKDPAKAVAEHAPAINKAVEAFLRDTAMGTKATLEKYDLITAGGQDGTLQWRIDNNFAQANKIDWQNLTEEELDNLLLFTNVNYVMNNIELHKTVFGDPYLYKDPTKRFKSFMSPRETSLTDDRFDQWANNNLNKAGEAQLTPNTLGYSTFKPYMRTITAQDSEVIGSSALEADVYEKVFGSHPGPNHVANPEYAEEVNEADAQSWISPTAYREFRMKNARWTAEDEAQFQYEMAYARNSLQKEMKTMGFEYPAEVQKADKALLKKGNPHHNTWYVLKPIGTGIKHNADFIDHVLDKTSMAPLVYSQVKDFPNAKALYLRMLRDDVSYVIMKSGRKVGYEELRPLYLPDGSFNNEAIKRTVDVPFKVIGIQVETSPHGHGEQTRGTQLTKLATMDLLENGMPRHLKTTHTLEQWNALSKEEKRKLSPVYDAIMENQEILEEMTRHGYQNLLRRLGVVDTGAGFEIADITKTQATLKNELLRRDANDNVKDSIEIDEETNSFKLPFEASASYQQIKNVLFSLIDKTVIKPKMSGGPKVQVSAALWEKNGRQAVYLKKGKWEKVEDYGSLSEKEKQSVRLTSNDLKFYTRDAPYMEVYLPHWFGEKLRTAGLTGDKLEAWMQSPGALEVLTGIGFRIPTQGLNSGEVFRVKGFLPAEMGDTIIVPSEITKKAGSDFDIDKLNTYLKNVYVATDGTVKAVPFFGFGQKAQEALVRWELTEVQLKARDAALDNLSEEDAQSQEWDMNKYYTQSLENAYYDSLVRLLTLPENYDRLVMPNSEGKLKPLRKKLRELLGLPDSTKFNTIDLLKRSYMMETRHNFIVGKGGVGIAAVQQTNHSLNQRSTIYVDYDRLLQLDEADITYLTGGKKHPRPEDFHMLLPHNTVVLNGKTYVSLSGVQDRAGDYISDKISAYINGYVDIAKDAFIVEIGASPNVASTFMFLEKAGVPTETVVMFMNQPIIREYLQLLDKRGKTSVFNKKLLGHIKTQFATGAERPTSLPMYGKNPIQALNNHLAATIEKAYEGGVYQDTLSESDKAEQLLILDEFLKYSTLADHQFEMNMATNFDTAQLNDAAMYVRKEELLRRTQAKNIISSAQNLLESSFIGEIQKSGSDARTAVGILMKTEQPGIRSLLAQVIAQFTQKGQFYDDKKFLSISKNVVSSFIEYITQTETGLNTRIQQILLNPATAVADKVMKLKKIGKDDPNSQFAENPVVQAMHPQTSDLENGPRNVKLKNKDNDVFTANMMITAFREIRDAAIARQDDGGKSYQRLVDLALIQGIKTSPLSFVHLIPLEDYAARVKPVIDRMERIADKDQFVKVGAFFRNNWKDSQVVPVVKAFRLKGFNETVRKMAGPKNGTLIALAHDDQNAKMPFVKMIQKHGKGKAITFTTSLFQRVEHSDGTPLVMIAPNGFQTHLYKQVNAWGDGFYGSEYYKTGRPSQFNNQTVKVEEELDSATLISVYQGTAPASALPTAEVQGEPGVLNVEDLLIGLGGKKVASKGAFTINGQAWYLPHDKYHILSKVGREELFIYPTKDDEVYIGQSPQGRHSFTYQPYVMTGAWSEEEIRDVLHQKDNGCKAG